MSVALRRRRVTVCHRTDKSTWPSEKAAWRGIERLMTLPGYAFADLNPYYCTVHKAWHVGNRP